VVTCPATVGRPAPRAEQFYAEMPRQQSSPRTLKVIVGTNRGNARCNNRVALFTAKGVSQEGSREAAGSCASLSLSRRRGPCLLGPQPYQESGEVRGAEQGSLAEFDAPQFASADGCIERSPPNAEQLHHLADRVSGLHQPERARVDRGCGRSVCISVRSRIDVRCLFGIGLAEAGHRRHRGIGRQTTEWPKCTLPYAAFPIDGCTTVQTPFTVASATDRRAEEPQARSRLTRNFRGGKYRSME